jgi:non-heme chloroperoxidase
MSYEERLAGEIVQKQESGKRNLEFPAFRFSTANSMSRKHRKSLISLSLIAAFLLTAASAQESKNSKPEQATTSAITTKAINLWPGIAPGSEQWKQPETSRRIQARRSRGCYCSNLNPTKENYMPTIVMKDGTEIYYKDWGAGQPLFFHHGWPLSADDWDTQMMFFLEHGYRVIAHDRRGHGRSTQTPLGHDMDTYASDVAEVVKALDLKNAVHIGHSTGGGEVTRYVARHGKGKVAKAVLISSIPPMLLKSDKNPDGLPMAVFDQLRDGTAYHRSQFYQDITVPFYGFNRPGAKISQGIRDNWWRQGMMGAAKAHYSLSLSLSLRLGF